MKILSIISLIIFGCLIPLLLSKFIFDVGSNLATYYFVNNRDLFDISIAVIGFAIYFFCLLYGRYTWFYCMLVPYMIKFIIDCKRYNNNDLNDIKQFRKNEIKKLDKNDRFIMLWDFAAWRELYIRNLFKRILE